MRPVLSDTRERHWKQNPYVLSLVQHVSPLPVLGFSWTTALFGDYGVLHVQWPEYLIRHRSWVIRASARVLFLLLLLRVRSLRLPVVRTMHNIQPHADAGRVEAWLLGMLDRNVVARVWLTPPETVGCSRGPQDVIIPHGDYGALISTATQDVDAISHPIDLLAFGIMRPYKGTLELISAVRNEPEIRTVVCGAVPDRTYFEQVKVAVDGADNVVVIPGRVPDDVLIASIRGARAVIAPYPELYNSGVVFLALTLRVPVIVCDSASARLLEREFTAGWVRVLASLDGSAIAAALAAPSPSAPPDFSGRSWTEIGRSHRDLFTKVQSDGGSGL